MAVSRRIVSSSEPKAISISVNEVDADAQVGFPVATFSVRGLSGPFTWAITSDPEGKFDIDAGPSVTAALILDASVDTSPSLEDAPVTVQASDGTNIVTGTFNIRVITPTAYQFVNAEAEAASLRVTTPWTDAHAALVDQFFTELKTGPTHGTSPFSKLDIAVLPMKTGVGDQFKNLIQDAYHPYVESGEPTFMPGLGSYKIDGVNDNLSSGFNPGTAVGAKFTRNSASWGVWNRKQQLQTTVNWGTFDGTDGCTLAPRGSSDSFNFRINQAANSVAASGGASGGHRLAAVNRSASNATQAYLRGSARTVGTNANQTSTALNNQEFWFGKIPSAGTFVASIVGGWFFGQSLTANEHADISAAFTNYVLAFDVLAFEEGFDAAVLSDLLDVPKAGSYTIAAVRSLMGTASITDNWVGSVLGSDGRVYAVPRDAVDILVADALTLEANRTTLGATIGVGDNKWHSGALARVNNCIYCFPGTAVDVLKINTKTQVATRITPSGDAIPVADNKWGTGCEDPLTGLILGAPDRGSAGIFQLDPANDSLIINDMGAGLSTSASPKFAGLYPVADGRIIGMPYSFEGGILTIRTLPTRTANFTEFTASDGSNLLGASKWAGGVYSRAANKIFGVPHFANDFLVIDLSTNTYKRITMGVNFGAEPDGAWATGFEAPDGKLYLPPLNSTSGIVVIDPVAETVTIETFGASYASAGWDGITLTPSGMAIAPPSSGANCLLLSGFTPNFSPRTLGSGYCNNF